MSIPQIQGPPKEDMKRGTTEGSKFAMQDNRKGIAGEETSEKI